MTEQNGKKCLICGGAAAVEIVSLGQQLAPICMSHWEDYADNYASVTRDEIIKYFNDGMPGDKPEQLTPRTGVRPILRRTYEERGDYETERKEKG